MPYPGAFQVDPVAAQDPDYNAFIRGAGYDEEQIIADTVRQRSQLQRQMARTMPGFADELRQGQAGIADQYGSNGLFRSGARMQSQADQRTDVARRQGDYTAGINDQISNGESDAVRNIAALRRQAADQGLDARRRVALGNAQAGIR